MWGSILFSITVLRESSPSIAVVSITHLTICNALPWSLCLAICGPSQGIRLNNSRRYFSNLSVWSCAPYLIILVFSVRNYSFISSSNFLISASIKVLFFLNRTLSFSSLWSLRFPRWIASSSPIHYVSCGYVIPPFQASWTIVSMVATVHGLGFACSIGITTSASYFSFGCAHVVRVLHMVL